MNPGRVKAVLLLAGSLLLFLAAAATFVAMGRSLLVRDTLSAVESAFGSAVLALLMLVFAIRGFKSAKSRLWPAENKPAPEDVR